MCLLCLVWLFVGGLLVWVSFWIFPFEVVGVFRFVVFCDLLFWLFCYFVFSGLLFCTWLVLIVVLVFVISGFTFCSVCLFLICFIVMF